MNNVHKHTAQNVPPVPRWCSCSSLVKVSDVTLDVIQTQNCPLVAVVVVLVLSVGAATQLVLYHLSRLKQTNNEKKTHTVYLD